MREAAATPPSRLRAGIGKFSRENQRMIRGVRGFLRRRFPGTNELVYDNYNFFVIGYGFTTRPSDCFLSLVASAKGVSVCFVQGARLPDPQGQLQGEGKQTRFLRVATIAKLQEEAVEKLFAAGSAGVARPKESGRGKLIIRSVSSKQRPRR